MKRSFKKPRTKRVKLAKPIPPPKPDRPKRGDLKKIYHGLITTDIDQRVNALVKALHWYDKCQVYVGYNKAMDNIKWTKTQLKNKFTAEEHRLSGMKSKVSSVKETHYITAIKCCERMLEGYKSPKLSLYLRELNKEKKGLLQHKSSMQSKHKKFLTLLHEALQPVNSDGKKVKLTVDKLEAPYRISVEGHVTLDRKIVSDLRKLAHRHGLLSAVINLLPVLSESAARIQEVDTKNNPTGRTIVDTQKRYVAVISLLNKFNQYCQRADAPKTIVRRKKETKA